MIRHRTAAIAAAAIMVAAFLFHDSFTGFKERTARMSGPLLLEVGLTARERSFGVVALILVVGAAILLIRDVWRHHHRPHSSPLQRIRG